MSVYHQILGVPENASVSEIKKAYRNLARQYHPDMNPAEDAAEQFIRFTEAYEILIGERKRPQTHRAAQMAHEDVVREKAKEYARMRYEEFRKRSDAFESTPMHKILWPRWVNFIFMAIALFFITDSLLPSKKMVCPFTVENENTITACNHILKLAAVHERIPKDTPLVEVNVTPIVGYVYSYDIIGDEVVGFLRVADGETEYILAMYILLVLAIVTLVNRTKKFENKLLVKIGMCIVFTAYAFVFLMWQYQ